MAETKIAQPFLIPFSVVMPSVGRKVFPQFNAEQKLSKNIPVRIFTSR